tara:strand:+ start:721 stop:864 length:144 start_codon:yes stop_codon:yes gene_type:complete
MDKNELKDLKQFILWLSVELGDERNYFEAIKPNLQKLLDLVSEEEDA